MSEAGARYASHCETGATTSRRPHSLLGLDPDLGNDLTPQAWRFLQTATPVQVASFPAGQWQPAAAQARHHRQTCVLLVIDGLLVREVQFAGRISAELFGTGDIIHSPDPDDPSAKPQASWKALTPGRVALLDYRALSQVTQALPLLFALASRSTQRGRMLGALALTRRMRRTDERLLFLLTFLASRWGRIRPDGIRLTLPASHELLARLIGTRRQSVTTALGVLRARGQVRMLPDGDWLLAKQLDPTASRPIQAAVSLRCDDTVSLLDVDRQLAATLSADQLPAARHRVHIHTRALDAGAWDALAEYGCRANWLGLLVLDGFLSRQTSYDDHIALEILGPGDLIRPCDDTGDWPVHIETRWQALTPATLALLDEQLVHRIAPWPTLTVEILARASRRARWLAARLAISQQTRLQTRILYLFSRLAARWGHAAPDGTVIPLALTHAQIGELIGAQRPSVSAALGQLRRQRLLARVPGGWWLDPEAPGHPTDAPVSPAARAGL
jgi:CRP/FNR family transcriptional regulator, cyclic AMP receptor protein